MTTITIPVSIEVATYELEGLTELLTATEWHRAAIVATFVRLDEGRGGRETVNTDHFLSARRFADFGIRGLASHVTVSHYVQCWLDECAGYPSPGGLVVLPTVAWPPQKKNKGSRATANKVREIVREMLAGNVADMLTDEQRADVELELIARRHAAEVVPVLGGDVRDTDYFKTQAAIDALNSATNRVELYLRPYGGSAPAELVEQLSRAVDRVGMVLDIAKGFEGAAWQEAQR